MPVRSLTAPRRRRPREARARRTPALGQPSRLCDAIYHGQGACLDSRTALPFDWRAFAVLLLAMATVWLGIVAFTDFRQLDAGEPDVAAQVSR